MLISKLATIQLAQNGFLSFFSASLLGEGFLAYYFMSGRLTEISLANFRIKCRKDCLGCLEAAFLSHSVKVSS